MNLDQNLCYAQILAISCLVTTSSLRAENKASPTPIVESFRVDEAQEYQLTWAKHLNSAIEIKNTIGMELRLIPAGEFTMGSPETEVGHLQNEHVHNVRITKSFYLDKYEVTRGQFDKFVKDTGYRTEAEKDGKGGWGYTGNVDSPYAQESKFSWRDPGFEQSDEHPVVNVSWNDALKFCSWLSAKEKTTYRLPTEAEWEYACRAGTKTRYQEGDDDETLAEVGNVGDPTVKEKFTKLPVIRTRDKYAFTAPVGRFRKNGFGIHDMHGNVVEWCNDWFTDGYYKMSTLEDPRGPDKGTARVMRGGDWLAEPNWCRSSFRSLNFPSIRDANTGFRVVRDL